MYKSLSIILLLFSTFSLKSQNKSFSYTSTYGANSEIFDVVENDGKYTFVGVIDTMNSKMPLIFHLEHDVNGIKVSEHVIPTPGRITNIFYRDNSYMITFVPPDSTGVDTEILLLDSMFNITSWEASVTGLFDKSTIIEDSILVSVGKYPAINGVYYSMFSIYSFTEDQSDEILSSVSHNKQAFYDLIKTKKGYLAFIANDTLLANGVILLDLSDSLTVIDTVGLHTYTNNPFINKQNLSGSISAINLSDTSFLMVGNIRNPSRANQIKDVDIGMIVWDTSFNEINMNIRGKLDTNEVVWGKSISRYGNHLYVGSTSNYDTTGFKSSEFMLTKTDDKGNPIWTKYYSNHTKLRLNKVLATSDGGAIMVGSSIDTLNSPFMISNIHVLKVDSNGMSISTSLNEYVVESKTIVYPNPATERIDFALSIADFYEPMNVSIFDVSGKLIDERSMLLSQTLDISTYDSGIYFYKLLVKGKIFKGKFVVSRR